MKIFQLKRMLLSLLPISLFFISFSTQSVDFQFNIKINKQSCKISVTGTSSNEVDFGNIQLNKIKTNSVEPIPIKVSLYDCKTGDYSDTYVRMDAKSTLNTVTFNDDTTKSFGVRISNKNTVASSTNNADFFKSGDKVWTNINSNDLEKTLYTYVKCKNTTCEPEVGEFSSTLTFSYIVD